jgi:hypothetical protein
MRVDSGQRCALSTASGVQCVCRRWCTTFVALGMAGFAVAAQPAQRALAAAHTSKSLYTSVGLDRCEVVEKHPDGNTWRCSGLPGYPLYVAEGDGRTFVSFGENAAGTHAAKQTLHAFNTPFETPSGRMTVEWRVVKRQGRALPYAAIVRYFTTSEKVKGEVLVVTRIADGEVCHVAYIDALANKDAIVLARALADDKARDASCGAEPTVSGRTGNSPM